MQLKSGFQEGRGCGFMCFAQGRELSAPTSGCLTVTVLVVSTPAAQARVKGSMKHVLTGHVQ